MKIKVVERYLALSLFILNLQACSAVLGRQKILVDLNLSRALPGKIMAIYSREMHGAMNYTVKGNARHTHIIGAVIDRGKLNAEYTNGA
ncbi:signal peptide containing protein [Theileria equi strain WA]|uniref:Signal peptide containing protein n=1 Tax=Theileria equi strain WA TaxID=1537102 RepID=L1LAA5_THEEQ|nr:signal peptide containing protein [Theileria equi strain WA]EKX72185.1 signal peptide containing protein [Theileria equi strain WA]|eukprot:XP_004831637.1 signal peptide containing protein [Theileria equi strain WA]